MSHVERVANEVVEKLREANVRASWAPGTEEGIVILIAVLPGGQTRKLQLVERAEMDHHSWKGAETYKARTWARAVLDEAARAGGAVAHRLAIADVDGEPRILDTALAEQLGMAQPLNIRASIDRNREELQDYGPIHKRREMVSIGSGALREVTVNYLNREQALLLCILARTERARQARRHVIEVFTRWEAEHRAQAPKQIEHRPDPQQPKQADLFGSESRVIGSVLAYIRDKVKTTVDASADLHREFDRRLGVIETILRSRNAAASAAVARFSEDLAKMDAKLTRLESAIQSWPVAAPPEQRPITDALREVRAKVAGWREKVRW